SAEHAVRAAADDVTGESVSASGGLAGGVVHAEHAVRDAADDAPAEQPVHEPVHEQATPVAQDAETRPKAPAETFAESTMELLLPDITAMAAMPAMTPEAPETPGRTDLAPTAPAAADGGDAPQGPPALDDETRTGGAGGNTDAEGGAEADAARAEAPQESAEPVTAKGLPKRTPKITAPSQTPRRRTGSVDAEALRRRLGGFRRGAQAGYRDVEAEIAEQTGQFRTPATGGTVEEASS
ncbi:histidine kinase, partial [Streptomyces sp. NPDC002521]